MILFPTFVLSCKSKAPEPVKVTCPDGFWKVPKEWIILSPNIRLKLHNGNAMEEIMSTVPTTIDV